MTERPDDERQAHHPGPTGKGDPDPTGVRVILSSLGDPGPMPHDLVSRISASLADEQARRERELAADNVHSLADAATRRRSLSSRLPSIAMAASFVILAGVVVLGVLSLNSGQDDAASGELTSADSGAMRDSADPEAAEQHDGPDDALSPFDTHSDADGGNTATLASPEIAVLVVASGTAVTDATLAAHTRELRARAVLTSDEDAEQRLATSAVNTPAGAAGCLAGLLAIAADDVVPRIDAIDSVDYSGEPAALILLTDGPAPLSDPDEPVTAYLVPLDCRPEQSALLREPARVA